MTKFGMYTNEGEIALASKLNEVLDGMPEDLTIDERYAFITEALNADSELCIKHGEWRDTSVRDSICWWAGDPEKLEICEARETVAVEFSFPIEVMTLDGDARAVLDDKGDEIHEIVEEAVKDALARIEERVGRIAGEWSGVDVRVI